MDNALRFTSSILTGSVQMTAAFLIYAVLAFLMWKSSRKSGKAEGAGIAMLISAIPGLVMASSHRYVGGSVCENEQSDP